MELYEAIRTRRSLGRVKKDEVPRELIERALEAASWAPSHHNTQPWKFIVMTGEGRSKLGEGYALTAAPGFEGLSSEEREEKLAKERAKAFRSPVVIAAVCSPSGDKRALLVEEVAASHAAVQNLLLALHAEGLAAIWRSGEPMYNPLMKQPFGLDEQEQLVGLIYAGYPDITPPSIPRTPISEKTVWIEQ
ncbi:nitroreductase family protein [Paenibacillus protaetiae]|uniref:Putative NAD(P)H nitroreductase n=1 Tax=Paenibacillus protaetiae TaxID=2509456 RepID=A0A4P6EXS7_9BACL|nr:nitroreductase [Paenibacillus protaetiae]QAY67053.1 nitroreductase [Paenibacillus protaetiae]